MGNVSSVIDNFSNSNPSYHRFNHRFPIQGNGLHARFLIFVEVETEQITFSQGDNSSDIPQSAFHLPCYILLHARFSAL